MNKQDLIYKLFDKCAKDICMMYVVYVIYLLIILLFCVQSKAESVNLSLMNRRATISILSNDLDPINLGVLIGKDRDYFLVCGAIRLHKDNFYIEGLVGERIYAESRTIVYIDTHEEEQAKHYTYANETFFQEISVGYRFKIKDIDISPFLSNTGIGISFGMNFK